MVGFVLSSSDGAKGANNCWLNSNYIIQKVNGKNLDEVGGLGLNCLGINRIVDIIYFGDVGGLDPAVGCVLWTI